MKKAVLCLTGVIAALLLAVACGTDPFFHYITVISDGNVISHEVVSDGETFTFPDAPNGSRNFSHWVTDRSDDIYYPGDTIKITGDIVITAVMKTDPPSLNLPDRMSNLQKITLDSAEDTTYYYTLDGTDPLTSSTAKSGNEISLTGLTGDITITVVAVRGGVYSQPFTKTITVVDPPAKPTVATDADLTKPVSQSTVLTVPVAEGTTVRYTTDGSVPTSTTGTAVDGTGFNLNGLSGIVTIKIARFDSYGISSEVETLNLKVKPVTPTRTDTIGTTAVDTDILTVSEIAGSTLYYTTDGTDPASSETAQSGNEISLEGLIGSGRKIRIVAVKDGVASEELSFTLTVKHAPFAFNSNSVKLKKDDIVKQDAVITAEVSGNATIHYTLDGTAPTSSSATATDKKINVTGKSGKTTIKAYAVIDGADSDVVTLEVIVCPPKPTTTLAADSKYLRTETIASSLFSAGTGETLVYTTDGTDPTASSPEIPADGIPLTGLTGTSATVRVAAVKDGAVSEAVSVNVLLYSYSLTYDLNGGSDPDNKAATVFFNSGDEIKTAGEITKTDYTFDGWYSGNTYYAPSTTLPSSDNISLKARWIDKSLAFDEIKDKDGNVIAYAVKCDSSVAKDSSFSVTIPAVHYGKPVTQIADAGFREYKNLAKVTFEDTSNVEVIGIYAFYDCDALTSVTIPASVTTLGSFAFSASGLTSVTFQEGSKLEIIQNCAFSNTKLTSVTIPEGVDTINSAAFCEITTLTTVSLPSTLTTLGERIFADSTSLTTINLSSVKNIGEGTFNGCKALTNVDLSAAETIGDTAFYDCEKLTEVNLPKVKTIGATAFSECSGLTKVTIGTGLTSVGNNAFNGATSSVSILIQAKEKNVTVGTGSWGSATVKWLKESAINFYTGPGTGTVDLDNSIGFDKGETITIPEPNTSKTNKTFDYWYLDGDESKIFIPGEEKTMNYDAGTALVLRAKYIDGTFGFSEVKGEDGTSVIGYAISCGYSCEDGKRNDQERGNYAPADGKITIPATYRGKNVIAVADFGFWYCSKLSSVEFEKSENITTIGQSAFNHTSITSFTIPKNTVKLGEVAFGFCTSLTEVVFEDGCTKLTSLPSRLFENSGLTSISIPSSITSIGSGAFDQCSSLASVEIGSGIESIASDAFSSCSKLTSVYIDQKEGETPLTNKTAASWGIPSTVTTTVTWKKDYKLVFMSEGKVAATIPFDAGDTVTMATVTRSGYTLDSWYTEEGLTNLYAVDKAEKTMTSPEAVGTVVTVYAKWIKGSFSFAETTYTTASGETLSGWAISKAGSSSDTSITIPATYQGKSVIAVADNGFQNCTSLTEVTFENSSDIRKIGDCAFAGCTKLTTFSMPDTVETIGQYAFNNTAITAITIPSSLKADGLGTGVFYNCKSLNSITFDCTRLTSIPENTFYSAKALTSITLPSTVTSIGVSAFQNSGLHGIEISESVTTIGTSAFSSCMSLKSVTFKKDSEVSEIGQGAFYGSALVSIEIPNSVTTIGMMAFEQCSSLSEVTFEDGCQLKSLPYSVFEYATSLTSITLPSSITEIGKRAFALSGLKSIDIPDGVTTIGEQAFYYCGSLKTVSIGEGITTISDNITYNESGDSLDYDNPIHTGKYENFTNCTALESIIIDKVSTAAPKGSPWGAPTTTKIYYSDSTRVIFDSDGGTAVASVFPDSSNKVTAPTEPTREGYSFYGWLKTSGTDAGTYFDFDNEKVTQTITLKAKWVEDLELGTAGPGGGIIFYDCDADNTEDGGAGNDGLKSSVVKWRYLEAAPTDATAGSDTNGMYQWCSDEDSTTALGTGTAIGTGLSNLTKIKDTNDTSKYPAFKACDDYVNNGWKDWFLPSDSELKELKSYFEENSSIGNFVEDAEYWSSSEASSSYGGVYAYYYTEGKYFPNHNSQPWSSPARVRPCRRF